MNREARRIISFLNSEFSRWNELKPRIIRVLTGVGLAIILTVLFTRVGALHKLQLFLMDTAMRLNTRTEEDQVIVVRITDEDYAELFGSKSPLDPHRLRELIDAVARAKPRLIAVDVDTSDSQFRQLTIDISWPPVIWEREPKHLPSNTTDKPVLKDVLGGQDIALNTLSGVAFLIDDPEDKVTRRYQRFVETAEGPAPTFPWIVAAVAKQRSNEFIKEPSQQFFIRYADHTENGHFSPSARQTLEMTKGKNVSSDNLFANKVVLIGGTYLDQDLHHTPLGTRNGVEILQQAIETEMSGRPDTVPNSLTLFLLEIFEGAFVIVLFQFFTKYSFLKGLLLNIAVILSIAAVCSYVMFTSWGRFTYFLPILICVWIVEYLRELRVEIIEKVASSMRA